MIGVLFVAFDTTIVNVAINDLGQGLHTSVSTAQWTISGYVLALGMVVPVAGWASDRFGSKQVWMGALVLFMVASVLSSVAWDIEALIAFRVLQGVGGGLMLAPRAKPVGRGGRRPQAREDHGPGQPPRATVVR